MPNPAIYVVAVVAGVAAGYAFKEFVYDPHLAPKIEQWTEAYAAYRRERRRRRASPHSHSHSDDEGDDRDAEGKSSVELESMVQREMQNMNHGGHLRHRKNQRSRDNAEGMIEKPNPFIPFEPLSPVRAPSASPPPNPFASRSDMALPIGRLPTPVSDRAPSSSSIRRQTPAQPAPAPPIPSITTSPSIPPPPQQAHTGSPPFPTSRGLEPASPESAPGSRAPSRIASEYDFVLHADESTQGSRATTPFSDFRATTPFTDTLSEASLDFTTSEMESSDAELLYAADSDAEFAPSNAGSEAELLHHEAESLEVPRIDARSDPGSDDWDRVSNAER